MKFYPITLGTGRLTNRPRLVSGDPPALDPELKRKILERDHHTCQCCGFVSEKYQQILHKNQDVTNFDTDNLLTTCIFCHQCFNIMDAAHMESAALIWLPEIEQHELNNIAKAIYVARISQGPIADCARKLLDIIMSRRAEAKNRVGTDNPFILGRVMSDYLSLNQYKLSGKKLEGLRVMPLDRRKIKETNLEFNQFPQILAYWRSRNGSFGPYPPQKWIEIYQDILSKAA